MMDTKIQIEYNAETRCPFCDSVHPGFVCKDANGIDGFYVEQK